MEIFNALNLSQITGGTKLKQGDFGSVLSYSLADENGQEITSFDTKTAYINLVLDDKIIFTTTTQVDISRVTFHIDKAIPTGLYYLEIKIDDYIFPSDKDSVILIEEGATAYDLKDLIPNYDTSMTITGILSDLSQKGIDISDLKTKIAKNTNDISTMQPEISDLQNNVTNLQISKADKSFVDSKFASIVSGAPKGTFATLAALQTAYPSGTEGVFLVFENGHWYYYASGWKDGGVYQSVGIADGSVGWKQRTPVGSQAQVQYFGTGKIDFDFKNKLIVIPKDTNIVVGNMVIIIGADITTAIPINDGTKFFILTVSLQGTNFKCYTNSIINNMSESEVVIAVCNNAEQTVEMNGDYLINGRAGIAYAQPVIAYPSMVTYKRNSDGTMLVNFVQNDQCQVIISYSGVQMRVPVAASYTLNSSEALVYNSIDNSLVVLNFDSLLPDSLIIIGNYHGETNNNNINAVQGDGNYEYYLDGTENVIYYAGTVTATKNGIGIYVNFDRADTRLFYKDSAGNHQFYITNSIYNVPHNFSLVLNRETKSLEVINTDNVIRGVHSILITCHQGLAKKVGMYFNSLKTDAIKLPTSGKIPINRYQTYVGQDATKVGDEYWLFDGSSPDHISTASIHRINPTDFSEIGLITHNLGHANGVDYRDNTLLVYNGGALPPEINLYKNPDNTKTDLKIQDSANTQIIFKESSKLLPGDGSACFGLDKKIVYYAYSSDVTQVAILKILLGLGDNDLSDKTTDKSDNQHWGSFVSGKSNDEYNGTAQIIASYTGDISGDTQPQGMAFNGDLYLGITHSEQKTYQLQLLDDGSFKVVDGYKSEMTDYKNNVIGLEPEITFIDPVKRSLFIGARGGDKSSLSNVAEFNL